MALLMRPQSHSILRLKGIQPRPLLAQHVRHVHTNPRRKYASVAPSEPSPDVLPATAEPRAHTPRAVLARVPTSSVLRSYLITGMSSSPVLLSLCYDILRRMLDSKSALMDIERNPLLSKLLKTTFYAQFCAGETPSEVKINAVAAREVLGYDGIILEYALEVLGGTVPTEAETAQEIEVWRKGMLVSVETASPGDFIGLKWSGLGRHALHLLQNQQDATPAMWAAITAACDAAAAKNVCLLPGAEEEMTNLGLEKWTLALQKKYNTPARGYVVVYTTYQCYLKSVSKRLAQHLAKAQREGYLAGVKLVRGAYLTSEPRETIWATKEETDANYDAMAEAVLTSSWTSTVPAPAPTSPSSSSSSPSDTLPFPPVNIVLGTHNLASVQKAQAIRASQLLSSPPESLPRLTYAQLQGMADEISQALAQDERKKADTQCKVVKCMAWGTKTECLNFLLRRAVENKEAAMRTEDTRKAMGAELWRRAKAVFGLA